MRRWIPEKPEGAGSGSFSEYLTVPAMRYAPAEQTINLTVAPDRAAALIAKAEIHTRRGRRGWTSGASR